MPRDGTGTFVRNNGTHSGSTVWAQDKAASIKITAANHDTQDQDIADGITQSLSKDGQTTPTANLPMGGYKLTNLGAGTARTDAANVGNVVDQTYQWGGTSSGAANTYAISLTPALTAYAAGLTVRFLSHQLNSGACTLNINSLGAVTVVKGANVACTGGEITNGAIVEAVYETTGGGRFRLLSKHMFLDNGTYLKARNAADSSEIGLIGRDSSDNVSLYDGKFTITSTNDLLPNTNATHHIGSASYNLFSINSAAFLSSGQDVAIGTQTGHVINFLVNNATVWQLGTAGHIIPASDNAYNIGSTSFEVASIFGRRIGTRGATDFSIATNNTVRWIVNSAGDIVPNANLTYNIGSSSVLCSVIWSSQFVSSTTVTMGSTAASDFNFTINGGIRWVIDGTTRDFIPAATNTYNLGSSSKEVKDLYCRNLRTASTDILISPGAGANTINFVTTTAGTAGALIGYLLVKIGGVSQKIPYYAV